MPRKVTPRWRETGVMKVPGFTPTAGQVAELGRHLGIATPTALSQLKPSLESIGARKDINQTCQAEYRKGSAPTTPRQ
jgi:hypothetical protein